MADQLDNRPVFTIVMGCNGAGKSAWKRANQDRLPERYFDKDSIADGIGGWETADARERTDAYVNAEIDKALNERRNFGIESTYSGRPGRALVERVLEAGYRATASRASTSGRRSPTSTTSGSGAAWSSRPGTGSTRAKCPTATDTRCTTCGRRHTASTS